MAVTRLSGGTTPANGSDPRTFPTIWNATADVIEANETAIDSLALTSLSGVSITSPVDNQLLTYNGTNWVNEAPAVPAGSVLQVVRGTDSTSRSTTSESYVDASLSVAITPTFTSSKIFILTSQPVEVTRGGSSVTAAPGIFQITDASNSPISGADETQAGFEGEEIRNPGLSVQHTMQGYDAPNTTSPVTYKVRYKSQNSATVVRLQRSGSTGQIIAMEVAG